MDENNEDIKEEPMVSLIVVNYNGLLKLRKLYKLFIDTLLQTDYGNFEVILIDNNSTDGSVAFLENNYKDPRLKIVKLSRNLGYTGAVEIGRKISRGDIIGVLNNDLIFIDRLWLRKLVSILMKEDDIAVISPLLLRLNRNIIDSVGGSINSLFIAWDNLSGRDYRSFIKAIGELMPNTLRKGYLCVALPPGAIFLMRREAITRIGNYIFDVNYFAYYEDVELGLRLQARGLKSAVALNTIVIHARGGSWGRISPYKFYLLRKNSIITMIKFFPLRAIIVLLPIHLLSIFYILLIYLRAYPNTGLLTYSLKLIKEILVNLKALFSSRKYLRSILDLDANYDNVFRKLKFSNIMPWYTSSLNIINILIISAINNVMTKICKLPAEIRYLLKYPTLVRMVHNKKRK